MKIHSLIFISSLVSLLASLLVTVGCSSKPTQPQASVAPAQSSDKTSQALATSWTNSSFTATLKEGFHFNEQAPNQLTVGGKGVKAKSVKPRELVFSPVKK